MGRGRGRGREVGREGARAAHPRRRRFPAVMETTHGRVDVKVGDIPPRCCCRGDGEAGCRAGREAAAAKALPAGGRAGPRARAMQQAPPLAKVSGRPPVSAAVQGVSARPCRPPPPLASAGALQQSRAGHEAVRSPSRAPSLPPSTHPPPPAPRPRSKRRKQQPELQVARPAGLPLRYRASAASLPSSPCLLLP